MTTEQETTQLEQVLKEGQASSEQEEVSGEETLETKEGEKPETSEDFETRVQSGIDTLANTYREKREADTAYIQSLQSQIKGLKSDKGGKELSKTMEAILEGDEDEGLVPDKIENRRKALEQIKGTIQGYREQSDDVEQAAQVITNMTKNMPDNIVREFGLDDANPNLRAVNGAKFLEETVAVYKHNQDFLMVVENFLPKGDELRKQVEEIVEGLSEFNEEKSKKLYLKDRLQGVKVTPRKKPPAPSDTSGGGQFSDSPADKVTRGLEKLTRAK